MILITPDKAVRSFSQTESMICFRDLMHCELDLEPNSTGYMYMYVILMSCISLQAWRHVISLFPAAQEHHGVHLCH